MLCGVKLKGNSAFSLLNKTYSNVYYFSFKTRMKAYKTLYIHNYKYLNIDYIL